MKQVVYADPENVDARGLEADALEQLGYQTENPTWRNEFLMGAFELRNGVPKRQGASTVSRDTLAAMTPEMALDFLGLHLNGPKADGQSMTINWIIPEANLGYHIELENSVLIYTEEKALLPKADMTLTLPKLAFLGVLAGRTSLGQLQAGGIARVEGDPEIFTRLLGLLDSFEPMFPIMTR
jgi:alkyl sulfatase BDS1-like metallo-beta-lactamase superfamily hydrolase